MSIVTDVKYDLCRTWIKRKRNKGNTWESIYFAGKNSEQELKQFLKGQIEDNDWPEEVNVDLWKQLVKAMEEAEKKKIQLQNATRMAMLHNEQNENNEVFVPEDEYSCWQLYKKHLKKDKDFSDEAIQMIEDASIAILKRLSINTVESGPVKGLVIGNVQSGKTANMAGLMAMAADWRWNFFIVLSGTIENLRKQTQNRLHKDLKHDGNLTWTQLDHLSKKHSPTGQRLCDLYLQESSNQRYMTVCLKVKSRLEDLIEWIEADQTNIKNLKVLVIDDEADQAGINTGDVYNDLERKTINQLILNLVHCRNKKAKTNDDNTYTSHYQAMNYISYTATPYANCLNEIGEETLYPKNFIRTLSLTRTYFGPSRFFQVQDADNDQRLDIVRNIPETDVEIINDLQSNEGNELPKSLKDAIKWFLCSAAVMRFYDYKKPVSMLIHTSQKQKHHEAVAESVKAWLDRNKTKLPKECEKIYSEEIKRFSKIDFRKSFPDYEHPDEEIWDYPDYSKINKHIVELLSEITSIMMDDDSELVYSRGIHLCIDNCANNGLKDDGMYLRLAYPDDNNPNKPDYASAFIVIGGNTLSRGLTLEGLVSTFFLRSVKQADTLMQMGRWFGYRQNYELLPRVWLTKDTVNKFDYLTDVDQDLREQIYQMSLYGKTPEEFSVALLTSPKAISMNLTSKKKMQMAEAAAVDFSGMDTQLTVYSKDDAVQKNNLAIMETFLDGLGLYRESQSTKGYYIWEGVPFDTIKKDFFDRGFKVAETSKTFQQIGLMTDWIKERTDKGEFLKWNVILCGVNTDNIAVDKIWHSGRGISIGKINRSCKSDSGDRVNIGVLSGKRDYVADITKKMLDDLQWKRMISDKNISNNYKEYREHAHVSNIPLFLIYVIDKNSRPVRGDRQPLNVKNDLVGITMVIPGIRGSRRTVTRIKIQRVEDKQEVDE